MHGSLLSTMVFASSGPYLNVPANVFCWKLLRSELRCPQALAAERGATPYVW